MADDDLYPRIDSGSATQKLSRASADIMPTFTGQITEEQVIAADLLHQGDWTRSPERAAAVQFREPLPGVRNPKRNCRTRRHIELRLAAGDR